MRSKIYNLKKQDYYSEINRSISLNLERKKDKLNIILTAINSLSPLRVLERGYSLVYAKNGKLIKSKENCSIGDEIKVRLYKGEFYANISKN